MCPPFLYITCIIPCITPILCCCQIIILFKTFNQYTSFISFIVSLYNFLVLSLAILALVNFGFPLEIPAHIGACEHGHEREPNPWTVRLSQRGRLHRDQLGLQGGRRESGRPRGLGSDCRTRREAVRICKFARRLNFKFKGLRISSTDLSYE